MSAKMVVQPDLEELMPHRGVMRFLQHLTFCSEQLIQGDCTIDEHNPFLKSKGAVSEGFYVELLAQLAAAAQGFEARKTQAPPAMGYLVGIKNFKVCADCTVGSTFHVELKPILRFAQASVFAGEVRNTGNLIASAELNLQVTPESIEQRSLHEATVSDSTSFEKILQENFSLLENQAPAFAAEISLPDPIPALAGHFPGHPIIPAAFLLDACFWTLQSCSLPQISEVPYAKFAAKIQPGQKLTMRFQKADQLLSGRIYANTVEAVKLEIILRS